MIKYKFPEEKEFILYFSKKLKDESIERILSEQNVLTEEDAKHLSYFYWRMIDCSIAIEEKEELPWPEGAEFWSEKVMYSISGFIKRSGFGEIWDTVVEEQ
ncbi:MAG: hypothetical protein V4732_06525 [Pseudomonadota bacterium]